MGNLNGGLSHEVYSQLEKFWEYNIKWNTSWRNALVKIVLDMHEAVEVGRITNDYKIYTGGRSFFKTVLWKEEDIYTFLDTFPDMQKWDNNDGFALLCIAINNPQIYKTVSRRKLLKRFWHNAKIALS